MAKCQIWIPYQGYRLPVREAESEDARTSVRIDPDLRDHVVCSKQTNKTVSTQKRYQFSCPTKKLYNFYTFLKHYPQ